MTNSIGTGTVNLSINVPVDERAILGRAAFRADLPMGQYVRKLILLGLQVECPDQAERLREVRRRYYGTVCLIVFIGGLCSGLEVARRRAIEERIEIKEAA